MELTGIAQGGSASSGARRSGRIRRRRSSAAGEGENVGGGVPGLFWSRETTRRTREDLRSSGRRRGGERSTVAAAIGVGGGGGSRVRGRESRGRRGGRGRVRAVRGSCVASPCMDRLEGGGLQREAGGGRRRRAPRLASARPPGRGGRGQGRRRWAGPAGGTGPALVAARVRPGKWPRWLQVMFLSLFYNSVLFYFFSFSAICF